MTIPRRLRFEILRRDGHTCRYCGAKSPDVQLEIDHVIPAALGGSDAPTNLVAACTDCNSGKSSVQPDAPLVEDIAEDALRWSRAMRHAADFKVMEIDLLDSILDAVEERWLTWRTNGGKGDYLPRPGDWRDTVERFSRLGLPTNQMCHFVDVAMAKNLVSDTTWKYFCGCCWRALTDLQEDARRAIEAGEV